MLKSCVRGGPASARLVSTGCAPDPSSESSNAPPHASSALGRPPTASMERSVDLEDRTLEALIAPW
jgi:hypothetical protein